MLTDSRRSTIKHIGPNNCLVRFSCFSWSKDGVIQTDSVVQLRSERRLQYQNKLKPYQIYWLQFLGFAVFDFCSDCISPNLKWAWFNHAKIDLSPRKFFKVSKFQKWSSLVAWSLHWQPPSTPRLLFLRVWRTYNNECYWDPNTWNSNMYV